MFKVKIGVVLTAVVAVFAISAAPSMAFKEFVAKNTGQLKDRGTTVQTFSTGGVGSVECKETKSEGTITLLKETQTKEMVNYSGCKAFGFPATVSVAEYDFNINGTTSVSNQIKIEVPSIPCKIVVEPTSNQKLGTVTYSNLTGQVKEVEIVANVTGITSTITGKATLCGSSNNTGTYKGTAIAGLPSGGSLEVV